MSKTVAIVFSDLHINLWSKFNDGNKRTLNNFGVLFRIAQLCKENDCPALFCGDMFHKPESMDQDLAIMVKNQFSELYKEYPNFKCYCIEGNHCIKHINRVDKLQEGWISFFSDGIHLIVLTPNTPYITLPCINETIHVYGIPYIDHNIGLNETVKNFYLKKDAKNILLLHTDYPGAKDTDGREVDSAENLNLNTLSRFDLVLCGHIHKPQRLSKKVYMVGAPLQQRRTDAKCKLGYWELHDDLSMHFKELKGYPKFIDVESDEEIKDDGNYYTVIPKKARVEVNNEHKITKQLSKKSLARRYMKEKGIKDKEKKDLLINILNKAESC
jgi:DNA repair exonuclease SbcCD nuclease subunit